MTRIEIESGPVTILTLKSENGLNLLHRHTLEQFLQILEHLRTDEILQVLVITGGQGKAFSAGANILELIELEDIPTYVSQGEQLMEALFHFPTPVIAAINGYALGAGFSLAMACEFRLAADTVKMGQLAVRNALIPPFGDIQRLLQVIGPTKARELIYTGKILSASEAYQIGLLNQICKVEQLMEATHQLAQEIMLSPNFVLRKVKEIINRSLEEGYAVGYLAQEEALIQCLGDPRTKAVLRQFFERLQTP